MVFIRNVNKLLMAASVAVVICLSCANVALCVSGDGGDFLNSIESPATVSAGQESKSSEVTAEKKCDDTPQIVSFLDSSSFDDQLSAALKNKCDNVTVKFLTPTQTNKIPERLDKWFSKVAKYGGTVKAEIDPEVDGTKGIFGIVFDIITAIAAEVQESSLYGPVENYNAILYYQKSTGDITRVFFKHK